MITLLLACAAPDSDTTTAPPFGADTNTEGPTVVTIVEDLGVCGVDQELDVHVPDGKLVGMQSAIVYEDGSILYRADTTAYVDKGWVIVRCAEGQLVTVIMWVLTE